MHIMDFVALFIINNRGILCFDAAQRPKRKINNYEVNVRLIDDIDCVGESIKRITQQYEHV